MLDTKMLGHELVLGAYVVVDADRWEWFYVGIRRRGRLPIAKHGGNDNEVLFWVQGVLFPNKPLIVRNYFTILV